MSAGAAKPPTAGPMAKPHTVIVTIVPLARTGEYSATNAIDAGIAPPKPIPVRKRNATSTGTLCASGVNTENRPNTSTEAMMIVRRSIRSPSVPRISAPSINPNSPALATGPNAARSTWNALIKADAA